MIRMFLDNVDDRMECKYRQTNYRCFFGEKECDGDLNNRPVSCHLFEIDQTHGICDSCGKYSSRRQKHHVLPVSLGGSNEESNLITICIYCHDIIHNRANCYSSGMIKKGMERAVERGVRLGPPIKVTSQHLTDALALLEKGMSYERISKKLKISVGAIHKIVKAHFNHKTDTPY